MKIAMLSPIAWRTPPSHYGPRQWIVSILTEGLFRRGIEVTLFATKDSMTSAKLEAICPHPYKEDTDIDAKVWEGLHIAHLFEKAEEFDLIHNHFDFLPLNWINFVRTPVLTTIHGFSSPQILLAYKHYNKKAYYVAISEADKSPELDYIATIYHGIPVEEYKFFAEHGDYLLFLGKIHRDKGTHEAIELARRAGKKLIIAGIIQNQEYYKKEIEPHLNSSIQYIGPIGQAGKSELLGKAYALIHLINFKEPFGLSLVEAMACGTPVIARRLGAIPEIIEAGRNGFIVSDLDEALAALKQISQIDRSECRKIVAQRFHQDRMVEAYIEVYKRILEKEKREEKRPWGGYKILAEEANFKSKKIWVDPQKRLSYQKHRLRSEHWLIISGEAKVTLDGKEYFLKPGEGLDIPQGSAHRIENIRKDLLVFIEIQRGENFSEDDIIRLEDDYGRIAK